MDDTLRNLIILLFFLAFSIVSNILKKRFEESEKTQDSSPPSAESEPNEINELELKIDQLLKDLQPKQEEKKQPQKLTNQPSTQSSPLPTESRKQAQVKDSSIKAENKQPQVKPPAISKNTPPTVTPKPVYESAGTKFDKLQRPDIQTAPAINKPMHLTEYSPRPLTLAQPTAHQLSKILNNKDTIKQAIILGVLLGPPKALQQNMSTAEYLPYDQKAS